MTLPTGAAVTFLFTDIEGSTRLERTVGSAPWAGLVRRHDEILRSAIESRHGVVVKTEGDAFFAAFAAPLDAVTAAVEGQRILATESWPDGAPIRITERGILTADPLHVVPQPGFAPMPVVGWAGPWPIDELWWDEAGARHVARFQLVGGDGSAWLMVVEDGQWWSEARYD